MTFPSSLHVHTNYGDGENSAEEMILTAIERGFVSIGFSEHAYAPYDSDCCIPKDKMNDYHTEVRALAQKYKGKIEVYTGLEVDYCHLHDKAAWDYVIGSVHYLRSPATGNYYTIDYLPMHFEGAVNDVGGGSVQKMLEVYAEYIADMALSYRPQILGHIDVVVKLNQNNHYFDPDSPWYRGLWEKIADTIAKSVCIVEVNTGGMSKGYTDEPYPDSSILLMLLKRGVPVTITSDAHDKEYIDYAFPEMILFLREIGYRNVKLLRGGVFTDYPII